MGEVDGMETASADPGAVSCPPLGRHRLVTVNGPGAALAVPGRESAQVTLSGSQIRMSLLTGAYRGERSGSNASMVCAPGGRESKVTLAVPLAGCRARDSISRPVSLVTVTWTG